MQSGPVYSFKVCLAEKKTIWRDIHILGHQTLHDLHHAIFKAFHRESDQLYSFYFFPVGVEPGDLSNAREYTSPDGFDDSGFSGREKPTVDAGATTIDSLGLVKNQMLAYIFDFGDEWWHGITVLATDLKTAPDVNYPFVADKKGKSPPQYVDEIDE